MKCSELMKELAALRKLVKKLSNLKIRRVTTKDGKTTESVLHIQRRVPDLRVPDYRTKPKQDLASTKGIEP